MDDFILITHKSENGIEFKCVSLFNKLGILCSYVGIYTGSNFDLNKLRDNIYNIDVHGGITWNEEVELDNTLPWMMSKENSHYIWIGWDYGHNDEINLHTGSGRKYSKKYLLKEFQSAVKQIADIIKI